MLMKKIGTGTIIFFILQAVGINFEIFVESVWSRLSHPPSGSSVSSLFTTSSRMKGSEEATQPFWIRLAGYTWVVAWFTLTIPFMIDPMVARGMFILPEADLRTLAWW